MQGGEASAGVLARDLHRNLVARIANLNTGLTFYLR